MIGHQAKSELVARHPGRQFNNSGILLREFARASGAVGAVGPARGRFRGFLQIEALDSADSLAGRKSPGPGNLPVEIFSHLPRLLGPIADLLDCIMRGG